MRVERVGRRSPDLCLGCRRVPLFLVLIGSRASSRGRFGLSLSGAASVDAAFKPWVALYAAIISWHCGISSAHDKSDLIRVRILSSAADICNCAGSYDRGRLVNDVSSNSRIVVVRTVQRGQGYSFSQEKFSKYVKFRCWWFVSRVALFQMGEVDRYIPCLIYAFHSIHNNWGHL